jgi:acyl-CoA reductase-like NAD-dependent aldehyde dehydrogenase
MSSFKNILRTKNYINGKWQESTSSKEQIILDKYSSEEMARIALATEAQMEEAIAASVEAFDEIRRWSAGKRSEMLQKLVDLLIERKDDFVELLIHEAGKPRSYSEGEIARCITTLSTAVSETLRFGGEYVPLDFGAGSGKTAFTKRFPIGPIACITPFNFPLNLLLHKVAPALALGCPVVIKPAPQSPLCTLALAQLVEEAGYPAGVFNALVCDIPEAEKMVKDDRLKMLSFTGSDAVGWYLKSICGKKKVALELGGNASVIIDESTDINAVAPTVAVGAFLYAGQICISTQRIFVVETVYEDFKSALIEAVSKLKVGDPSDPEVLVGPVIDGGHLNRITDWVNEAVDSGAELLCGGKVHDEANNTYYPTLLSNAKSDMKVCSNEVFGPVAILEKVADFDEAIKKTNDSRYGLQVGVFTNSVENFKKAFEEIEVGGVIINNIPGFRIDSMPYGGIKDSGLGREGIKYAMEEMSEPKLLVY